MILPPSSITVQFEMFSEVIFIQVWEIEFKSRNWIERRSDSELSKKNGGIKGYLFETFWENSSVGFEGPQTFFGKKNIFFHLFSSSSLFIFSWFLNLVFHLLFHFLFSFQTETKLNKQEALPTENSRATSPAESERSVSPSILRVSQNPVKFLVSRHIDLQTPVWVVTA